MSTSERANHSRWCVSNPKRAEYVIKNNGRQLHTTESNAKRAVSIKQAYVDGKYNEVNRSYPGWKHTAQTKQHLKEKALASPHRRLVRSIREYVRKDGTIVKLDSSWEEALAIQLDATDINWIRPGPIKWIDESGITHNYFPDFYLTDYDVYLDPKNPYAIKAQQAKLKCLTSQIKNLIIITSLEDCKMFTPN